MGQPLNVSPALGIIRTRLTRRELNTERAFTTWRFGCNATITNTLRVNLDNKWVTEMTTLFERWNEMSEGLAVVFSLDTGKRVFPFVQ